MNKAPDHSAPGAPGEPAVVYTDYTALHIAVDEGVADVTIDHPPVNLFDPTIFSELHRFAAVGRAGLAQPEVLVRAIPGGGGTQYLPRLAGRARARNRRTPR